MSGDDRSRADRDVGPPAIEIAVDAGDLCGESPIWDAARGRVVWVDKGRGQVCALEPASGRVSLLTDKVSAGGVALHRDGGLVLSGERGLQYLAVDGGLRTIVDRCDGEALFFNDLTADAEGRVYAGTMHWGPDGMEKPAKVYLIDGGDVRALDDGYELANGLAVSGDGRTFYATDSTARRIYAYDRDPATGAIARRRVLVQVPRDEGLPDGLVLDADGFLWSAQWYGGRIVRYDPDGRVERRIALPAAQTSCPCFGGPDLGDLYVATAAQLWPSAFLPTGFDAARPTGGALYRIRQDVRGRLEHAAAM